MATTHLAFTVATAQQVAAFWLADGGANLKNATPYAVQPAVRAIRLPSGAQRGKPGYVEPAPGPASPNGKLPTTSGKVFFVAADGQPHWCTGTAVQSASRNLVATAGHCLYDTEGNSIALDKWVFVPGYSEGTTPWGLYVGKEAFADYDFDVYEDSDRDYTLVTVYNGVVSSSPGVLTDSGRLVDNIGGQGLTYNQPMNASVDVFGYPAGPNPDGTQPYAGQTLERSHGKTFNAMAPAIKGEDLVGTDSPFTNEGSLGSSWLLNYGNGNRSGYLNGITISVSDIDRDNRYDTSLSPYFDDQFYDVYSAAKDRLTGPIA
ncbi:trypsin-like serine peptidase [Microtetraspora malaysiensis]|uniref:trypsin-like serine peptidase n=1 Tax=Microtetraspora malaysiensis TaxID=161358 RepID=UPI003D93D9FA